MARGKKQKLVDVALAYARGPFSRWGIQWQEGTHRRCGVVEALPKTERDASAFPDVDLLITADELQYELDRQHSRYNLVVTVGGEPSPHGTIAGLEARRGKLEAQRAQLERDREDLAAEKRALEAEVAVMREKLKIAQGDLAEVEQAAGALRATVETLEEEQGT